jgi:transcriptional regulator with XRE-family HTH domain
VVTGAELKAIREAFGLSAAAMGRALGYSGPKANIAVHIRRFERGDRHIPFWIARLALMYSRHGIPQGW